MAKVFCCYPINDRRTEFCGNDTFIIHSSRSMQCSKCGHFFNETQVTKYNFVNEYSIEKQEPVLEKLIRDKEAKLVATLYPFIKFSCKGMITRASIPLYNKLGPEVDNYNRQLSVPTSWADIYITKKGTPIVAYYFDLHDDPTYLLGVEGEMLVISEELPKFGPLEGTSRIGYKAVPNPDKLVFTGATVGGITTGGFHTQSGGVHYESQVYTERQQVTFKAGRFGDGLLEFSFEPGRLDIYEPINVPGRILNKRKLFVELQYSMKCVPPKILQQNRDFSKALIFDPLKIEDIDFRELILGAVSDEELYRQASELASKGTKKALTEAGEMFLRLGNYKDSQFHANDSFYKAQHTSSVGGCYVATAVYGSYDCPQVWTLRRYRDYTLAETWYGRAFIHTYYAISPTLVKWFGETEWFRNMWKPKLDKMVKRLNEKGVADTPYQDRIW